MLLEIFIFIAVTLLIIGYLMYSIYTISLFRKFNGIYIYSSNIDYNCKQLKNNNAGIEKNTDINIEYNQIIAANIEKIIKRLKNYSNIIGLLYIISLILLIIKSIDSIKDFMKNIQNYIAFILIFIPLAPFLYSKTTINIMKKITNDFNVYKTDLINVSTIFDTQKMFDINSDSGNPSIEIFKHYLANKIVYDDNLELVDYATAVYSNHLNNYLNGKDEYCHLIDYIDFKVDSTDFKLLKAILCGGINADMIKDLKNNEVRSLITKNQILDNNDKLNTIEQVIKELMKMSPSDFKNLLNSLKNIYNPDYDKYINEITSQLPIDIYPNSNKYFSGLSKDDSQWNIWKTEVSVNDDSLARLFSSSYCIKNALNLTNYNEINSSINNLANKSSEVINNDLKNIINSCLILMIMAFFVVFYIIFHSCYKYNSNATINYGIGLFVFYCIEEIFRINVLLQ